MAVEIDREAAQDLARRELGKPEYRADDPSIVERIGQWVLDRFDDVLGGAEGVAPGGAVGLLVIVALVVLVVVAVLVRVGGVRRGSTSAPVLLGDTVLTADEHRALAERAAADGRFADAVRERLRAVARDLESRGVIDARPGRTAEELVRDTARALPDVGRDLADAARVFSDIWYGGRTADVRAYDVVVNADTRVRAARTALIAPRPWR